MTKGGNATCVAQVGAAAVPGSEVAIDDKLIHLAYKSVGVLRPLHAGKSDRPLWSSFGVGSRLCAEHSPQSSADVVVLEERVSHFEILVGNGQ